LSTPSVLEGEERVVRVPLLSLVGARLLAIKEIGIAFEVGLNAQAGTTPGILRFANAAAAQRPDREGA
jgi:hypothetical protein